MSDISHQLHQPSVFTAFCGSLTTNYHDQFLFKRLFLAIFNSFNGRKYSITMKTSVSNYVNISEPVSLFVSWGLHFKGHAFMETHPFFTN